MFPLHHCLCQRRRDPGQRSPVLEGRISVNRDGGGGQGWRQRCVPLGAVSLIAGLLSLTGSLGFPGEKPVSCQRADVTILLRGSWEPAAVQTPCEPRCAVGARGTQIPIQPAKQ